MNRRLVTIIVSLFLPCADPVGAAASAVAFESVKIEGVPHVTQKPDFCGEACVEMALRKLGYTITQDDVFNLSTVDPNHGRGCRTPELAQALKALGFKTGAVWRKIAAGSNKEALAHWESLHADLVLEIPTIVCMRTGTTRQATEHFRLVLGYDAKTDEVIYHEPAERAGAYRRMKRGRFLDCWPLKYEAKRWTLIRLRLKPGRIRKPARVQGFTNADYAQHVRQLKEKVRARGFTIVVQKPFVCVGDESSAVVRARAVKTVKWAADRLKAQYFAKDPDDIIDIWLFKNKASYEKHTREFFGEAPDTPFGYSSATHKALIMNIATGGGTLVHEIVHPFVAANFPDCPAWLNEGLGSLYEQSCGKKGQIYGLTNWRLAGLQKAIMKKAVPSFRTLTGTTDHEFYNEDKGTHYAQARYLCYYLQEKGLLKKFYHKFHKNRKKDPTGYETLKSVLREKDMDAFKRKWESSVLKLRFP